MPLIVSAVLVCVAGMLLLAWMVWILWQMRAQGAPFWPTSRKRQEQMLEVAQIRENDRVIDLGSGDGRLVIAAAERGAKHAAGYEIDPFWFNVSQEKRRESPHVEKIQFIKESFWDADLSGFDVVFLYQGKHILKPLTEKLRTELPAGARIISNSFQLPDWQPQKETGGVYLYVA